MKHVDITLHVLLVVERANLTCNAASCANLFRFGEAVAWQGMVAVFPGEK